MKQSNISVAYENHMGSDLSVVNAARVSFDKWHTEFTDDDARLIAYLVKHNHWSPLAHNSVQLRIKAPIFLARQLVKHSVGLVWNEVSRRYVDDEPEFYIPDVLHNRPDGNIKQGSGNIRQDSMSIGTLERATEQMANTYKWLIDAGVAPEEARMILPLNTMTEWLWTGSVAAFGRVCKQRLDSHAQLAAQECARMISDTIRPLFPITWKEITK